MLGDRWFREFQRIWPFPDNYITIDVETSGFSPTKNLLCTFGWCVVRNRQVVENSEIALNWFNHPDVNAQGLIDELNRVAESMLSQGKNFYHTPQYLRDYGMPPLEGLNRILAVLRSAEAERMPLIGFNGFAFDAEFIQAHLHDFLEVSYMIGDNNMYDAGMAEKAAQLHPDDDPLPLPNESLRTWAFRIYGLRRRGIYWAQDRYCENKYRLVDRYRLDHNLFHRSAFDSLYLHMLFEAQRELATRAE